MAAWIFFYCRFAPNRWRAPIVAGNVKAPVAAGSARKSALPLLMWREVASLQTVESTNCGWQPEGSCRGGLGAQVGLVLTDRGGKRQYLKHPVVLSGPAKARNSQSKMNVRNSRFGPTSSGEFDFIRQPFRFFSKRVA
jgi:hypothetical protein